MDNFELARSTLYFSPKYASLPVLMVTRYAAVGTFTLKLRTRSGKRSTFGKAGIENV